jgi:hypothetical protein
MRPGGDARPLRRLRRRAASAPGRGRSCLPGSPTPLNRRTIATMRQREAVAGERCRERLSPSSLPGRPSALTVGWWALSSMASRRPARRPPITASTRQTELWAGHWSRANGPRRGAAGNRPRRGAAGDRAVPGRRHLRVLVRLPCRPTRDGRATAGRGAELIYVGYDDLTRGSTPPYAATPMGSIADWLCSDGAQWRERS